MGCGSSSVSRVYDRRAYHGVAVAPPIGVSGADVVASSPTHCPSHSVALRSHCGSGSGGAERATRDRFRCSVSEVLQRQLRRRRVQEWRHATAASARRVRRGSDRMPRHDYLAVFGSHRLAMVDEVSYCVLSASEKTLSECLTVSASRTTASSLTTSCATAYVNQPSVRFDPQASLHLSESSITRSAVAHLATRSCCSFAQAASPSFGASSAHSTPRSLHSYAVHPCNCGHAHRARLVLFSATAGVLLSCSTTDCFLTAYHVAIGGEVGRLVGHDDVVLGGAVSPDGALVATASRDCTAILWELPSCKQRRSLTHPQPVLACRFSGSGAQLATACADGLCRIWAWCATDAVNVCVSPDTGFGGALSSVAYSLGDRAVLAGGAARHVFVWERENFAAPGLTFEHHQGAVLSIDASRVHRDIVMSAEEATVLVWNCATLTVLHRIDVSSCDARVRPPRTGVSTASVRRTSLPHESYWTAVRLVDSPFGLMVAVAGSDKCLHLFECGGADVMDRAGDDSQVCSTGAAALENAGCPPEMLCLPFSSSISSIDAGPPSSLALGDTCGNRFIVELR
ncbi:WD domain, G-beta repeat [Novymonas esmeraldas]|uniref:WD domain, G-beta repeat n=1 Tax=Novymonas esmeraldas TaxID=1808958 RepID=A0AAW0ESX6_9TRYP